MRSGLECPVARNDVAVKLDAKVAKEAKMVAAARGITLAEYITEILRPIVHRDLQAETSKILDPDDQSPKSRRPKPGA
jgi:hypothetical protein